MTDFQPIIVTENVPLLYKEGQYISSTSMFSDGTRTYPPGVYIDIDGARNKLIVEGSGTTVIDNGVSETIWNADAKLSLGKVTRSASVVVGLESSGYSSDQVDVLIKSTDNAVDKITEAMTRLSSFGGEVKLLEGTYEINKWVSIIHSNITLNGTGMATILKVIGTNEITINAPNISFQNMTITAENESFIIFSYRVNSTNVNWNNITFNINNPNSQNRIIWFPTPIPQGARLDFSNCKTNVPYLTDKTSGNWRNIFVDGVAEYVALNNTVDFVSDSTINLGTKVQIGDELTMQVNNPTYAIYRTLTYRISQEYMVINNIINVSPSTGNIVMFDANISSDLSNSQMHIQYVNSTLGGITPDPNFKLTYISFRRYSI